jgi:hypothetical protein
MNGQKYLKIELNDKSEFGKENIVYVDMDKTKSIVT